MKFDSVEFCLGFDAGSGCVSFCVESVFSASFLFPLYFCSLKRIFPILTMLSDGDFVCIILRFFIPKAY